MGIHGVAGGFSQGLGAIAFEQAAEVAVADDAEELAVFFHRGHTELFAGHFVDHVLHRRAGRDAGDGVAGVHELLDAGQALAELAAGMEGGEVLGAETFFEGDGDGEGVSKGEHGGGGRGGGKAHAAGLGGDAAIEGDVAGESEGGLGVAAEADERVAGALDGGEEAEDFFGFAAGGEGDYDVSLGQHAEVSVDGLGGVEEECGAACGAEGGGNFLGDDAAFAHAGDDDAASSLAALKNAGDGAVERRGHGAFEALGEGEEGLGLDAD